MIFGENQVRQLYVVDPNHVAGAVTAFNNLYLKYNGPDGNGGVSMITSDKFKKASVTSATISKPAGITPQIWTITATPTLRVGEDYIVYMDFQNWNGFGRMDCYHKFAVLHGTTVNTASAAAFYDALADQIEQQFKTEPIKPFTVTSSASGVVLTEKVRKYDRILGLWPTPLEVTIAGNEVHEFDANGVQLHSFETWASVVKTSGTPGTNGYIIADMEDFFSKGRADLYGYNGYPYVHPSVMVADPAKDYYILDIHYSLTEEGMLNQASEKDLSIAIGAADVITEDVDGQTLTDSLTGQAFLTALKTAWGL